MAPAADVPAAPVPIVPVVPVVPVPLIEPVPDVPPVPITEDPVPVVPPLPLVVAAPVAAVVAGSPVTPTTVFRTRNEPRHDGRRVDDVGGLEIGYWSTSTWPA